MGKELFNGQRFASIEHAQSELDAWVETYNRERVHQGIGDVAPIRRFELVSPTTAEVLDPDPASEPPTPSGPTVMRRVDRIPGWFWWVGDRRGVEHL